MNWFDKIQLIDLLKESGKRTPIIKTATCGEQWDNQEGDWLMFGNVNRYRLDAYAIKVFLSKTQYNWTIRGKEIKRVYERVINNNEGS